MFFLYYSIWFVSKETINVFCVGNFIPINTYFCLFQINLIIIYIFKSEILKTRVKTGFSVYNINLYLCGRVENTKWILCSCKIGVKCAYLKFLMYNVYFSIRFVSKETINIFCVGNFKPINTYFLSFSNNSDNYLYF